MTSDDTGADKLQPIDDLDPTIHSLTRMKILAFLAIVEEADFTYLLTQTGLTRGNLSPNLRKLEEAGYVQIQKEFVDRIPRTLIRLTEAGRSAIQKYQQGMQRVLDEFLKKK
jgi:DNA-binding MarR family transcriptional regulator